MEYSFTPKAIHDFKKVDQQIQKRLITKLDYFSSQDYPIRYAEPLVNSALGHFRFRVGDYRIIFDVKEDEIVVLRIGHRKNIYS